MIAIEKFAQILFSKIEIESAFESVKEYKIKFSAKQILDINSDDLPSIFSFIESSDSFHISITIEGEDPITYSSQYADYSTFISTIMSSKTHHTETEEIKIVFTITKLKKDNYYKIYDFERFIQTIGNYTPEQFIHTFSEILDESHIFFSVIALDDDIVTQSFSFLPASKRNIETTNNIDRNKIIENFKLNCNCNISLDLIPEDFKINTQNIKYSKLNNIFTQYSNLLSIIYLFDLTFVKENKLQYKLSGYKSINSIETINNFSHSDFSEYLKIYEWVYTGGNFSDKIGIARNIISLHFSTKGELKLQENTFESIRSNFRLYEKQNIKQYIEVRNKITDQLLEINQKANKIVDDFANGFQKSALLLLSFYISTIVLRVMNRGNFSKIFSFDVTVLSLTFLLASTIYFSVSYWEITEQRKRYSTSYYNLKSRYTDLLEPNDINKILNQDKDYSDNLVYINNKVSIYSSMWIAVIAILSICSIFLFISYNLNQLCENFFIINLFPKLKFCKIGNYLLSI